MEVKGGSEPGGTTAGDIGGGGYHPDGNGQGIRPSGNNTYTVWGRLTLPCDVTIPDGATVTIPHDTGLTVPKGVTLTNNGTIVKDYFGSFINNGTVTGQRPDDDRYFIDYENEVIGINNGYEYEVYTAATGGTQLGVIDIITDYIGQSLYIQQAGSSERIEIKIPARPAAPSISTTSVDYENETFTITLTSESSETLQYNWTSSMLDSDWDDYTGSNQSPMKLSDMGWDGAAGNVYVRFAATDQSFASEVSTTMIQIPARPEKPASPTTVDVTSDSITIQVVDGQEYRIGSSGEWEALQGTAGSDGKTVYTYENLTPGTEYTIETRTPAETTIDQKFASWPASITVTTERADSTLKVETSSTTLTYGETLTIKVTPEQTADTNTRNTLENAVELYIGNKLLVTDAGQGPYTLIYDTKEQDLSIGENTLTVSYGGSDSLNPSTATVNVTLEKKEINASLTGTATKPYDGTTNAPAGLTIELTGVLDGDDVAATGTIAYDTKDVGDNKTITASNLTLTGADAGYYNLMSNDIKENTGSITAAALGGTVTITGTAQYGQQLTASYDPVHEEEAVSYQWNRNGEIISGATSATYTLTAEDAGQTITVTATAVDSNHTGSVTSAPVTVEKPYTPPANPNYRVDLPTPEHGTITADPAAAKAGTEVTLTVTPEEGYQVGDVTVTDRFGDTVEVAENADGTYTFTMPNGQVRVEVTFVEATPEPLPFTDVAEGDWFHDAVQYAYENGLMDGVGDGQFAPNATTNRAMVVTILYRLAGEPAVSGDTEFTDVAAGQWYTDAVTWAAEEGVVNGVSATQFAPGNNITREQLATILFRYAQAKGYDVSPRADLSGFPDAGDILPYAQEAMAWAVAEGLLQGFEDDTLRPQGTATRAQIATILMRFCETVAQ